MVFGAPESPGSQVLLSLQLARTLAYERRPCSGEGFLVLAHPTEAQGNAKEPG